MTGISAAATFPENVSDLSMVETEKHKLSHIDSRYRHERGCKADTPGIGTTAISDSECQRNEFISGSDNPGVPASDTKPMIRLPKTVDQLSEFAVIRMFMTGNQRRLIS